jgi:hypothetical protein
MPLYSNAVFLHVVGAPGMFARPLADPVLVLSAYLRTALALGIVFIMSTKPDRAGAMSALAIALALGLAAEHGCRLRRQRETLNLER